MPETLLDNCPHFVNVVSSYSLTKKKNKIGISELVKCHFAGKTIFFLKPNLVLQSARLMKVLHKKEMEEAG